MKAVIMPGTACGQVTVPASKSVAHRALLAAALTPGITELSPLPEGEDVAATREALAFLGARTERSGSRVTVTGIRAVPGSLAGERRIVHCRESGTTLRLLVPVFLLLGGETVFTGQGRLMERPMAVYEQICRERGLSYRSDGQSVTVSGTLTGGEFFVPGHISSQFISGLLLALPHGTEDSRIHLTSPLQSASYLDLTLRTLADFGYTAEKLPDGFFIPGKQEGTCPGAVRLPADESSAAFFGALEALGGRIRFDGDHGDDLQGDRVWRELFPRIAAGCPTVSVADCPDLAPILMATAALFHGICLTDTARLRFKESDRGQVMAQELRKCGVQVTVEDNRITVSDGAVPPCVPLSGHNDHRIAMSLAVLLTRLGGELEDALCVRKSLPDFWNILASLGLRVTLENPPADR